MIGGRAQIGMVILQAGSFSLSCRWYTFVCGGSLSPPLAFTSLDQ